MDKTITPKEDDEDFYDDFDRDDEDEWREQEEYEIALNCTCGAWGIRNNRVYHIADCICGAE